MCIHALLAFARDYSREEPVLLCRNSSRNTVAYFSLLLSDYAFYAQAENCMWHYDDYHCLYLEPIQLRRLVRAGTALIETIIHRLVHWRRLGHLYWLQRPMRRLQRA